MFKIVLALILLAHAIGHTMGMLQLFRIATINPEWHGDSWLLTGSVGTTAAQVVGVIAWLTALVGFAAVAGVVVGWLPAPWWVPLSVVSASASILGIVLFPLAFPTFSTIAALVVDVAVLAAALWLRWTPAELAP